MWQHANICDLSPTPFSEDLTNVFQATGDMTDASVIETFAYVEGASAWVECEVTQVLCLPQIWQTLKGVPATLLVAWSPATLWFVMHRIIACSATLGLILFTLTMVCPYPVYEKTYSCVAIVCLRIV